MWQQLTVEVVLQELFKYCQVLYLSIFILCCFILPLLDDIWRQIYIYYAKCIRYV